MLNDSKQIVEKNVEEHERGLFLKISEFFWNYTEEP
jgi:hypothetical protein